MSKLMPNIKLDKPKGPPIASTLEINYTGVNADQVLKIVDYLSDKEALKEENRILRLTIANLLQRINIPIDALIHDLNGDKAENQHLPDYIGNHRPTGICPCILDFVSLIDDPFQPHFEQFLICQKTNTSKYHVIRTTENLNQTLLTKMFTDYWIGNPEKPKSKSKKLVPIQIPIIGDTIDQTILDVVKKVNDKEENMCIAVSNSLNKKKERCINAWTATDIAFNKTIEELENTPDKTKDNPAMTNMMFGFVKHCLVYPPHVNQYKPTPDHESYVPSQFENESSPNPNVE
jgi:hypothetical protein